MPKTKRSKASASDSSPQASKARDPRRVVGSQLGTRQRTRYVIALKELSDDDRLAVQAIATVLRSPRPGAPRQLMLTLTLCSERVAEKIRQLRELASRRGLIS